MRCVCFLADAYKSRLGAGDEHTCLCGQTLADFCATVKAMIGRGGGGERSQVNGACCMRLGGISEAVVVSGGVDCCCVFKQRTLALLLARLC